MLEGTIGFVKDTKTPWEAQCPTYKNPTKGKKDDHALRCLHLRRNRLNKFKLVCVLDTGQEIYAPPVKQIRLQHSEFGHLKEINWELDIIVLHKPIIIKELRFIDDLGYFFYTSRTFTGGGRDDILHIKDLLFTLP